MGILIPTSLECLYFVIPYSMWAIGISLRSVLKDIFLPVLVPSILTGIGMMILNTLIKPVAMISILAIGSFGLLVFAAINFSTGASSQGRKLLLDLVRNGLRSYRRRLQPKHSGEE
jgi:uncharacterized Tic20 family protein